MSKKDNGLFNFPVNLRAKQERVSFEEGGEVKKYLFGGKTFGIKPPERPRTTS